MHTLKSGQEILRNYPVKIRFAGWESTTTGLASAGWELAIEEERDFYRAGNQIRIAAKLAKEGQALYIMTHPLFLDYAFQSQARQVDGWIRAFQTMIFDVAYCGPHGANKFRIYPSAKEFSFKPFDATPILESYQEVGFEDFQYFKTATAQTKELILDPTQLPEMFEAILKVQSKMQKEITKREQSRENLRQYRNGEMFGAKPAHTVQAQIITLEHTA